MHVKYSTWIKHIDFIIADLICINVSFYLAYVCRFFWHPGAPISPMHMYGNPAYRILIIFAIVMHFCITFFTNYYSEILYRGYFIEFQKVLIHNCALLFAVMLYLVALHTNALSRIVVATFFVFNLILMYLIHAFLKRVLLKRKPNENKKEQLIVMSTEREAKKAIKELLDGPNNRYNIAGIALKDEESTKTEIMGIPVIAKGKEVYDYAVRNVVDAVILCFNKAKADEVNQIAVDFLDMGITVHVKVDFVMNNMPNLTFSNINSVNILTTSNNEVSAFQVFLKRVLDIAAGIVGCLITGILFIFLAPIIKIKDPAGPIFFGQQRVGRNGRIFKIYKFRSMYSDAEERKKDLMAQNKMEGLMFKLDADPRIIGSGPDGTKKGFGYFIRATSLDEFPNFWSILKGDMSLVGTRPPTMDEYERYELHHKSRLAAKPGLTGMWQISGRSDMTDFEEIVKMDTEYIQNWNIGKDIKIILKTVWVVIARKGSQ